MFQVKPMQNDDFKFAAELSNTMHWNMAPEDFEFNVLLEPKGCFVAFEGSKRIGIATCISFGQVGWFGNLIIAEKYRKKGVGRLLIEHAVNYLKSKGAKTIGLYAYSNLTCFYGGLGFKQDEDFALMTVETLNRKPIDFEQIESGRKHIREIENLDSSCFGGNRDRLLESIILDKGNLSYCHMENGKVAGYIAATVYEKMAWIGPLICKADNTETADLLVAAVLSQLNGLSVYAVLPKKERDLHYIFSKSGFKEEFSICRMFNGETTAKNCIYLAESLERG